MIAIYGQHRPPFAGVQVHIVDTLHRDVDPLRRTVPGQENPKRQIVRVHGSRDAGVVPLEVVVVQRGIGQHLLPVLQRAIVKIGKVRGGQLVDRIDIVTKVGVGRAHPGNGQSDYQEHAVYQVPPLHASVLPV